MLQTSTRSQKRRIARKRQDAFAKPQYNETHPLGNRVTRRHQARNERTIMQTLRKEGLKRHLKNCYAAMVKGYKMRMAKIQKRKLSKV